MEKEINIAEILKNKPKGTRLYSPIFGECAFSLVQEETDDICVKKHNGIKEFFDSKGLYNALGECLLFPSREMRDWSKFAWKKGDVLVHKDGDVHIIFERFVDDTYCSFVGKYYLWKENNNTELFYENERLLTSDFQKAGKDAAQTYINTIEERLGGKLNRETLEVEKTQPEFKDGDIVAVDLDRENIRIFKEKKNENNICFGKYYIGFSFNNEGKLIQTFKNYTADCSSDRLATEEEKQQLFDALAKEGKAWDAKKKMIVDLKPNVDELKPFDKVLVKDNPYGSWEPAIFWKKVDAIDHHPYMVIGGKRYRFCEPYEGNEHFLND